MHVLGDMAERLSERFAFRMIYIREAHAADVWPIGAPDQPEIQAPRSLEERAGVAQQFVEAYRIPLETWVDDPASDAFQTTFAAWPFRFFAVSRQGFLLHKAMPTADFTFCPMALEAALDALLPGPA